MDTIQADSIVARAGANVPAYTGTVVTKELRTERSWQVHLKGLLIVSFKEERCGGSKQMMVMFLDGDSEPLTKPSGPPLRHFRNVTLEEVNKSAIRV